MMRQVVPTVLDGWLLDGVQPLDSLWPLDGSAVRHGQFASVTVGGAVWTISTKPAATWTLTGG